MSTRDQAGMPACGSAQLSGPMVGQSRAVGSWRPTSYAIAGAGTDGPGLVLDHGRSRAMPKGAGQGHYGLLVLSGCRQMEAVTSFSVLLFCWHFRFSLPCTSRR